MLLEQCVWRIALYSGEVIGLQDSSVLTLEKQPAQRSHLEHFCAGGEGVTVLRNQVSRLESQKVQIRGTSLRNFCGYLGLLTTSCYLWREVLFLYPILHLESLRKHNFRFTPQLWTNPEAAGNGRRAMSPLYRICHTAVCKVLDKNGPGNAHSSECTHRCKLSRVRLTFWLFLKSENKPLSPQSTKPLFLD